MSTELRNPDAVAACEGKQRFGTPAAANAVKEAIHRRRGSSKDWKPFHCPHCGGWHLAHINRVPVEKLRNRGRRRG